MVNDHRVRTAPERGFTRFDELGEQLATGSVLQKELVGFLPAGGGPLTPSGGVTDRSKLAAASSPGPWRFIVARGAAMAPDEGATRSITKTTKTATAISMSWVR